MWNPRFISSGLFRNKDISCLCPFSPWFWGQRRFENPKTSFQLTLASFLASETKTFKENTNLNAHIWGETLSSDPKDGKWSFNVCVEKHLGPEHRNGERPYWNWKDYYYYYFFPDKRSGFLRALTCSKMSKSLQGRRKWWKFTYSGVFGNGRGKMAQQRHLERSP